MHAQGPHLHEIFTRWLMTALQFCCVPPRLITYFAFGAFPNMHDNYHITLTSSGNTAAVRGLREVEGDTCLT